MDLFGIEGNPIPEGATIGTVVTAGGVRLRYALWQSNEPVRRGTILLMQGRAEAIEKYFEVVEDLRRRGFAVATFDWRGQGGSERQLKDPRKGHVDSFAEYDRDLDAVTQQVLLPDCRPPYFALAHSTGALIAVRAAVDGRARFERMVLASPLIAIGRSNPPEPIAAKASAVMTAIGLGEINAPGEARETIARLAFEGNRLSGDAGRFARNKTLAVKLPQVFVEGPTFAWLHAAYGATRAAAAPGFASRVKVPALVLIGALDRLVSVAAAERFATGLRAGAHAIVAGAQHELLMERDPIRAQFYAAFDAFIPGS